MLCLVACGTSSSPPETESLQSLGDLHYRAPSSGWSHRDMKQPSRLLSRWTPDDNTNKETISIVRTELRPSVKPESLAALLTEAQMTLPSPSVHAAQNNTTRQQLREAEISADFVPRGLTQSYHRVHAVIIDGTALVHVLYTARTPDPTLAVFHQVVDSIHRGES
jgi:hypothetical protein